jgi:IS605 OrfB family transposase
LLTLTAKIKICPSADEQMLLRDTMKAYSAACNFVSAHIFLTRDLSLVNISKDLYSHIRAKFALRSQMAQSAIKTVIASYKTILENQKEWIQPYFKKPQCDLVWNRDYSLRKGQFSVNTLMGRKKVDYKVNGMRQYFDGTWSFGTAKLVHKHGKWFLHIPMSKEIENVSDSDIENIVGIDLGINFIAASYDSGGKTKFFKGRPAKQHRAECLKTRKELQMRRTPRSRHRLKAIGARENRWMQDVNHCVSKALVESNPKNTLLVIEDLTGIRAATERVALKYRYVSVSWAFYDLRKKLEYKALKYGSKVIAVDPAYTSQTCPKCEHAEKKNRNSKKHIFKCKDCGYTSNDDRAAAMNLYNMGIKYLSAVASE